MPSFFQVTEPGSPVVEMLTRDGLESFIGSANTTFAHRYCRLMKEKFPNDPSKWVFVQRPKMRRIQLLP